MAARPVPRKRKDGTIVWRQPFRLRPGGQVTYETFTTREEAERFGRLVDTIGGQAARDARTASTVASVDTPTLATWLERHLEAAAAHVTPGTVADYRRMAARTWLPRLGPLPLDAITREAVVEWVAWQRKQVTRRGKPYAPKSIANAHALLSSVLASAVDADLIPRNVARRVPLPTDAERPDMVILSDHEIVALIAALPERWRPLVGTLVYTGLRWGEATALTPGDLDLDADVPVLRVTRAWKKGERGVYLGAPKTKRGRRTVSLPGDLVPVLRTQVKGKTADDLLFTAPRGGRVSAQHFHGRVWRPAIERSGIGKRPRVHDLRHSHASHMLARGYDLFQLSRRLGHESVAVTGDVYGHLMPDAHAQGAAAASLIAPGAFPQIEP